MVGDEHVAGLELRILEDVGDRVDRPTDDADRVERGVDLLRVVESGPLADDGLDLLLVVAASTVVDEPRVIGELRPANRAAQSPKHVVLIGGNGDPLPVAALEDV